MRVVLGRRFWCSDAPRDTRRRSERPGGVAAERSDELARPARSLHPQGYPGRLRRRFASRGELGSPFVSEHPGGIVARDLSRRCLPLAVDCPPVRLDDQVRTLHRESGDRHDAAEWTACVECEERATRTGHPRFERRFVHRGIGCPRDAGRWASGGVAVPAPRTSSGALAVRGAASRTLPRPRGTPNDQVSPARTAKS